MKNNQEKVWDAIAENWNKYREVPSPSVVDFLKHKTGKVLDLGCGSGRNFNAINKKVQLYATDFSGKMLEIAEKNALKKNLQAEFKKAEAYDLPFEKDFFDSVICIAVLHCIPEQEKRKKVFQEMHRVLKPKGNAFVSCWGRNSPRLKNKPKECFVAWSVEKREKEKAIKQNRYTYVYDLKELEKQAVETGFVIEKSWEQRNVNLILTKK